MSLGDRVRRFVMRFQRRAARPGALGAGNAPLLQPQTERGVPALRWFQTTITLVLRKTVFLNLNDFSHS